MITTNIITFIPKYKKDIFFLFLIFLFQLIFIFQGLDIADAGTYATMYQRIFNSPDSLQFMFNYWLTAVIGGLWIKLFPAIGLLGIRIAGVLVTTLTVTLAYVILRKYIKIRNLRVGLIIALLIQVANLQTELYYNKLSILFWMIGLLTIFIGLKKDRIILILISGVAIGLNIFIRLPNLLGVFIAVSIFYYGWLTNTVIRKRIIQTSAFFAGVLVAIIFTGFIMSLLDHLDIYINSLKITAGMGTNEEDSHNLINISVQMFRQLTRAITWAMIFFNGTFLFLIASHLLNGRLKFWPSDRLVILGTTAILALLSISGRLTSVHLVFFLIGIVIIVHLIILLQKDYSHDFKLLSFLGIVIVLTFPFGSASGLALPGKYTLLIALPIALEALSKLGNLSVSLTLNNRRKEELKLVISKMKFIPKSFIYISLAMGLVFVFSSPYSDLSNRCEMFYSIDHEQLKGIYTTKERATVLQELLNAGSDYIKPGDTVLTYADIPLYHYLTETKPYFRNPWSGQYTSNMLSEELEYSLEEMNELPVVVINKVNVRNTNWPKNGDRPLNLFEADPDVSRLERHKVMQNFLSTYHYETVWENVAFAIMLAENSSNLK